MQCLSNGPVDMKLLKDSYESEILNLFAKKEGPLAVYWDKSLLSPINVVVGNTTLQKHGLSKSFILEENQVYTTPDNCKSIVFLIKPTLPLVELISKTLYKECYGKTTSKKYYVIAVPRFSLIYKNYFKEKHTLSMISEIEEFDMNVLPLDCDLVSSELSNTFCSYALEENQQFIYEFAKGLMRMQSIYGLFPKIIAKGEAAQATAKILVRLRKEDEANSSEESRFNSIPKQFDTLLIMDRSADPITPLLNQLSYEGLIREKWGIHCGCTNLDFVPGTKEGKTTRIGLNSGDELYNSIRDLNFTQVGVVLNKKSRELTNTVNETKTAKDLVALRKVVDNIPEIRKARSSLELQTLIAENLQSLISDEIFVEFYNSQQEFLMGEDTDKVSSFIEDCICYAYPLNIVLRLICLQSLCNGGLKKKVLQHYKREILQVYGFEHLMTIENIEKLGFLFEQSSNALNKLASTASATSAQQQPQSLNIAQSNALNTTGSSIVSLSNAFSSLLRKLFRIFISADDESVDPLDSALSEVYAGYIPLSVRIVQILTCGWPTKSQMATVNTPAILQNSVTSAALMAGRRLVKQMRPEDFGDELASMIPGETFEEKQTSHSKESTNESGIASNRQVIAVAFLGGITNGEIACLRKISNYVHSNVEFVIITTNIIDSSSFFQSMCERVQVSSLSAC